MNKTSWVYFCIFFGLICIQDFHAQLEAHVIDGEAWAKGNYVEIGVNAKGVYGANTNNKPLSFHENREFSNYLFGFIANPLKDNWVDYDGDFFTPGLPEEGFSIQIQGQNYNNNNEISTASIAGGINSASVIISDCYEDIVQIVWEGNVNGLNVKRYYSITENGLFIQMYTVIKNISSNVKSDVYFMHNVDPDNNVTLSGKYETKMELISQASSPADPVCLVKASQEALAIPEDMDGSYVSLYTSDHNARVTYGGFDNRSAIEIWNGSFGYTTTEGSSLYEDVAMSIAFNLGDIAPNESKKFNYYYILEDVDDSFIPFIVNTFVENTSTCNGNDGKIVFSGLTEGSFVDISYIDDGVFVPQETYEVDSNGEVEIINLNAGIYSNITLNSAGCSTVVDTEFELKDPAFPEFVISKKDFTDCDSLDGALIFSGLIPSTSYTIQFTKDGDAITPTEIQADTFGIVTFDGLGGGVYTNFMVEQFECLSSSNEIIEITGPTNPISYAIPHQYYCDSDYDYITTIDLSELNDFVIGADDETLLNITYHLTEEDVLNKVAITRDQFVTTNGQSEYTLYARKTNTTSNCFSYLPFSFTINIPPPYEIEDNFLCLNSDDSVNDTYNPPILDTNLSDAEHSFRWFLEGNLIDGAISSSLIATKPGLYAVEATIDATGCSYVNQATITPSGPPKVLDTEVTSLPFSNNHTVEISASGNGNYVYSVDEGQIQESPIFTNLDPGYHTFQIIDINGCGTVEVPKILIDYMKAFTPNGDGFNDYWQIIGVEGLNEPRIYIFDRYGKILKQLDPDNYGWDGTFNGELLPSSDYWFKVQFKDDEGIEREFIEHFSLKR